VNVSGRGGIDLSIGSIVSADRHGVRHRARLWVGRWRAAILLAVLSAGCWAR